MPSETTTFEMTVLASSAAQCAECASRLCDAVSGIEGVEFSECDPGSAVMTVRYDPSLVTREVIEAAARRTGLHIQATVAHSAYRLHGLDCPDCARSVGASVERVGGVLSADVNFASATLLVEHAPDEDPSAAIGELISAMGYGIEPLDRPTSFAGPMTAAHAAWSRPVLLVAASGSLIGLGWALGVLDAPVAAAVAYAAAIAAGGALTVRRALVSMRSRVLDMNVLMSVAVIGAVAIGEWAEAATVIFLFALGGVLESRSLERTRRSIRELLDLAPPVVRLRRDGGIVEASPEDATPGEVMIVRPGERVPLDGVVLAGNSAVDESAVTGESVPADKAPGDTVFAGTLNAGGLLEVEVTAVTADTTLARIVHLVEEAQASRAPVQTLVERFARWYTPTVVGLAAAVATVPPIVGPMLGWDAGGFGEWLYRALVLLVVSCPCALVVSTPVAVVSGITRATRDGVLVKGGAFLEMAAKVRAVAFDKTGTLTYGRPEVADIIDLRAGSAQRVLETAAALETGSGHPLAQAVLRAAGPVPDGGEASGLTEEPGRGVTGTVCGVLLAVGSSAYLRELGALDEAAQAAVERLEGDGHTALVLAELGSAGRAARPLGVIGVSDEVRVEAAGTMAALREAGIRHTVMLTGDNERTAAAVAAHASVTGHMARLLPGDKVGAVKRLQARYGAVAMVGDGVNDAPALAAADVGIAMGVAASDTALEAADVALLRDDLSALPRFFSLGVRTVAIIRQNVAFSMVTKAAVLVAALAGHAPLWLAVFADTGVALLVILNGMRLLRAR